MQRIDLTGKRFGRLLALEIAPSARPGIAVWKCVCDCGKVRNFASWSLRKGTAKSCGCIKRTLSPAARQSHETHGMTNTPTFRSWTAIISRCYNPNSGKFPIYGGRGIKICEFLRVSPANLRESIGERPPALSIDRIDVNGNYSCGQCAECLSKSWPKNIRWATPKQQARNRTNNRIATINGETKCAYEWAEKSGLPEHLVLQRLNRGWSGEKLLIKPLK